MSMACCDTCGDAIDTDLDPDACREDCTIVCRKCQEAHDIRPANCRFRLQDEGKPYPRSGCSACGATVTTLGNKCSHAPVEQTMKKPHQYAVYRSGPGSLHPLFTGSKTDCLHFMAHALKHEPDVALTIRLAS